MNIGVFGGTFDPPHIAHLVVAEHVREALCLDRILFVPSATPPHKRGRPITPSLHRLNMLRLAVERNPLFDVLPYEVEKGGVSFTVDTLAELKRPAPGDGLFLLIGMDNYRDFDTWREPERILSMATVVVMTRPGFVLDMGAFAGDKRIIRVEVPAMDVSSTGIRERLRDGASVQSLIPERVAEYIGEHDLYRSDRSPDEEGAS
jgi:nicotinate-nucleotide adenylyltransferase